MASSRLQDNGIRGLMTSLQKINLKEAVMTTVFTLRNVQNSESVSSTICGRYVDSMQEQI